MWHLEKPTKKNLDDYANRMITALGARINKSLPNVSDILIPTAEDGGQDVSELKGLLTDEPESLFLRSERLIKRIIHGYDLAEILDFCKAKKSKSPSKNQKALITKYEMLEKLEKAFDYI